MDINKKALDRFNHLSRIIKSCKTIAQLDCLKKFCLNFERDTQSPIIYGCRNLYVIGLNNFLDELYLIQIQEIIYNKIFNDK